MRQALALCEALQTQRAQVATGPGRLQAYQSEGPARPASDRPSACNA